MKSTENTLFRIKRHLQSTCKALVVISCDDFRCVMWRLSGLVVLSLILVVSLHYHPFPRIDQGRLEPALIWEIHTAKAAAGRPRGWHCHHLVMTTTSGVAKTHIPVFECSGSFHFLCHRKVMMTLDGKACTRFNMLACGIPLYKIWLIDPIQKVPLLPTFIFLHYLYFTAISTDPLPLVPLVFGVCAVADAPKAKIWMDYRL